VNQWAETIVIFAEIKNLVMEQLINAQQRSIDVIYLEKSDIMKILVIDIETGGLYHSDPIFEIGAVVLDTITGSIKEEVDYIIQQEYFNENAWAFQHSSLTPEMVRNGIDIEDIRDKLQNLFNIYPVTAFNRKFDIGFLQSVGFRFPKLLPDPMIITTDILCIPSQWHPGEYKWPSVQECLEYYKINDNEPHRAAADAKLEARIIWELIKSGDFKIT